MANVKIVSSIPQSRTGKRTQRAYSGPGRPALWPGRFQRAREAAPGIVKLNFATAKSARGMAHHAKVWAATEPGRFNIVSRSKDDGTGSVYIEYLGD